MFRQRVAVLFLLCLLLVLTACGANPTPAANEVGGTSGQTTQQENTPEAAAPTTVPTEEAAEATPTEEAAEATPTEEAAEAEASPYAEASPTGEAMEAEASPTGEATEAEPTTAAAAASEAMLLVLVPEATEARYHVTEQFANQSLPNEAVGTTKSVSGTLVIETDGNIVQEGSKFVVDMASIRSDSDRRDRFIQNNTLETGTYPTAEFVPTTVTGLPSPLPTEGEVTFQLTGDMTLHGVTRATTWDVTAQIEGQELVGTAKTNLKFGDFNMEQPRVAMILSIEDNIRLELDFRLRQES